MSLTAVEFLQETQQARAVRIIEELRTANSQTPDKLLHRIGQWLEATTVSLQQYRTPGLRPTTFDSSSVPSVSVASYLRRLGTYAHCSPSCYVAMLIYLDRYLTNVGPLTPRNAHRLVLAGLSLAVKYWEDYHYDQEYFAYIGGVKAQHLTKLEIAMMKSLNFELHISPAQFEIYNDNLHLGVATGEHFLGDEASTAPSPTASTLNDQGAISTMAGTSEPSEEDT